MFCFQLTKSDWQAVAYPQKDGWKSSTMVSGEQSVMTTSMTEMLQSPVINWDLGKGIIHYHLQSILSQIPYRAESQQFVLSTVYYLHDITDCYSFPVL